MNLAFAIALFPQSPTVAAHIAGELEQVPPEILVRICRRESMCRRAASHRQDVWASKRSRRKAMDRKALRGDCGSSDEIWSAVGPWGTVRAYVSHLDLDGCLTVPETRDSLTMATIAAKLARATCAKPHPHPRMLSWLSGLRRSNPRALEAGKRACRKIRRYGNRQRRHAVP